MIWMRHYEIPEGGSLDMKEVGPSVSFEIRRVKTPSDDLRKQAYKKIDVAKPKKKVVRII